MHTTTSRNPPLSPPSQARTYIERYNVMSFPHIAFIDPRTGRSVYSKSGWSMENPVTAETFLESAVDFCDSNSFDRLPKAPLPPRPAPNKEGPTLPPPPTARNEEPSPPGKRSLSDASEQDQVRGVCVKRGPPCLQAKAANDYDGGR